MSGPPITAGNDAAAAIRLWLLKAPRPQGVRVYAKDGREFDIEIKQGTSWSDTAVSIAALVPERLEATNGPEGKMVRAVTVADLLKKEEQQAAQAQATFSAMNTTDPETQRMIVFAELLERGYSKAYESSQNTVQVAFTQLQEICGSLAQQASAAQQSATELSMGIRNLLIQQAHEAVESAATPQESPMEKLAANFLSGQQMAEVQKQQAAAATAPKNGKPNGNGKHP